MKKKLKALMQGNEPIGNAELSKLKKAMETAKLNFKKAKTAKSDAKSAFKKAAEEWLCQIDEPHTPVSKSIKKAPKASKATGRKAQENGKSSVVKIN